VATTGLVQPQQIPAVKLWPRRRVVSGTPHWSVKPTLPLKCLMEFPGEGRGGAGGPRRRRVPRCPGRLANTENHKGSPGSLARNGAQDRGGIRRARPSPAWARWRRRGGVAGDLTRAGRGSARVTACAGVCTRVRLLLPGSRVGVATGRHGGVHGGARLDAMGGGERGVRDWLKRVRVGSRR
jgi:hypothetical protein